MQIVQKDKGAENSTKKVTDWYKIAQGRYITLF